MRLSVLGWFLGLPLVVLIWGLAIQGERAEVSRDLEQRTKMALDRYDLVWAEPAFNLNEGHIKGAAYSEKEQQRALDIARSIWGVWNVEDRTHLVEKAPNYVWGAAISNNNILLTGYVPNEGTRRQILDVARQQFPDRSVNDEMRPARGAPGESIWIDGINFGLRQLMQLKQGGQVKLKGTELDVSGEAESVTAYRSIKGDFHRRLPSGIRLAQDNVKPPVASPFTWRATYNSGQLELDGSVPAGKPHDRVIEIAKEAFPNAAIVDKMTEASGEPKKWLGAIATVLRGMAKLDAATAAINDTTVQISGIAVKEATSERVAHDLRIGMPDGFKVTPKIAFKEATLPTVKPFTTSILSDGRTVRLSGHAPSERSRDRLVDSAKSQFAEREIIDSLSYANGAPAGWTTCVEAGLLGLALMDRGRADLSDTILRLEGESRDEKIAAEIPAKVRAAANRACTDTVDVTLKAPPEPRLKWQAVSLNKKIELSGEVIHSDVKASLLAEAKKLFPEFEVVNNMRVTPGRSSKWEKVVALALNELAKLRSGVVRLEGLVLTLDGVAPDTAVSTQVKARIKRGIPAGYSGQAAIEVKSDAMIWSEQEAKRKSEAAAAQAARKKKEEAERQAELREVQRKAAEAAAKARAEAEERQRKAKEQEQQAASKSENATPAPQAPERPPNKTEQNKAAEEARLRVAAALADVQRAAEENRRKAKQEAEEKRIKAAQEAEAKRRKAEARRLELVARQCKDKLNETARKGIILFEVGSNRLTESSTRTLDKLIETYRSCPGALLEIGGHTDSTGNKADNQQLSQRRAEAVLNYFVKNGLPREKFVARGYGETRPLASNQSAANRAKNRRIEFDVMTN